MIIEMVKGADGTFAPADEMFLPALQGFKNGEMYPLKSNVHAIPISP
ncbi:hypothetical protein [Avibacterium paragallinarum]